MTTFLRMVIGVTAAAGVIVGLMLGTQSSLATLQAGALPMAELIYLVLLGIAVTIIIVGLLAGHGKVPSFVLVVCFAVLGVSLSGLVHEFVGKIADAVLWTSGCSFGAAIGLVLARRMTRGAQQRKEDR